MEVVHAINPKEGMSYARAKVDGPPPPAAREQWLRLTLEEMRQFDGREGGRILLSVQGKILDVSEGRENYGPDGSYEVFAGRDITKNLAMYDIGEEFLDQPDFVPENEDTKESFDTWYESAEAGEGAAALVKGPLDRCPISGQEGSVCPITKLTGIQMSAKKEALADSGSSARGKKSMLSKKKGGGKDESFLDMVCPLHWTATQAKVLSVVYVVGITFGWFLRGQLNAVSLPA